MKVLILITKKSFYVTDKHCRWGKSNGDWI